MNLIGKVGFIFHQEYLMPPNILVKIGEFSHRLTKKKVAIFTKKHILSARYQIYKDELYSSHIHIAYNQENRGKDFDKSMEKATFSI